MATTSATNLSTDLDKLESSSKLWMEDVKGLPANNAYALNNKTEKQLAEEINELPMMSIDELATLVNEFLARRDNPNQVTKAQVGLSKVANYSPATESDMIAGTANDRYVTPQMVKAAFQKWVSDEDILAAIEDLKNGITGLPTDLSELLAAIGNKLDKDAQAADSKMLAGQTLDALKDEVFPAIIVNLAKNSEKLGGKSLAELTATWTDVRDGEVEDKFVTPKTLNQLMVDQSSPALDAMAHLFGEGAKALKDDGYDITPWEPKTGGVTP